MSMQVRGVCIAGFIVIMATAVYHAGAAQDVRPPADRPCVIVWRYAGMQLKPNEGLVLAVWNDGTILFSHRPERLGEHLLIGRVALEDIQTMLVGIRAAGFWEKRRDYVVPDSRFTTIVAHSGNDEARHSWHECLLPGFGGDINTDKEYRSFVRMWKKTMGAITALAPIEVQRLSEKVGKARAWRGYVVDEPHKTVWRP